MVPSRPAGARAGKVPEQRKVAAPKAVEDSAAVAGDLIWAALAAVGSLGTAALRQWLLVGADSKTGQQLPRAVLRLNDCGPSCPSMMTSIVVVVAGQQRQ